MSRGYERKVFGKWFNWGYSFSAVRLGFSIGKYGFSLDLFFVYIGMDW